MSILRLNTKLLVGQCITIEINKSTSCIACNKIQPVNNEEEFVTCKNCKMTTLASSFLNKACFPKLIIKTDQNKLENFACFNYANPNPGALQGPKSITCDLKRSLLVFNVVSHGQQCLPRPADNHLPFAGL